MLIRILFSAVLALVTVSHALADDPYRAKRMDMVERQIRGRGIRDARVLAAMEKVPRHLLVDRSLRPGAYSDHPLPIGEGQTISQPYVVALMTEELRLSQNDRVLEIGTGSGYQAAILAHITPHVWSVETRPELGRAAQERLHGLGYAVAVKIGDGWLGWPEHAPYDAIIVTAAAPDVPPALVAQLAEGGRLVIPVGESAWDQTLWAIERAGGKLKREFLCEVRFVPLVVPASRAPAADDPVSVEIRRQLNDLFRRF